MNGFTLHRTYDSEPEKVWAHFTEPALLARWFCPNPGLAVQCTLDVRPGGAWRCVMGPYVVSGAYVEVVPPSRLVFTWSWEHEDTPETTVTVTLVPDPAGTRVALQHSDPATEVDGHRAGWEITLDRLAEVL